MRRLSGRTQFRVADAADSQDFLRPIVTPYELEVAMQAEQSWTGRYVLDFGRLLADATEGLSRSLLMKEF
jgi:hypothetical protein